MIHHLSATQERKGVPRQKVVIFAQTVTCSEEKEKRRRKQGKREGETKSERGRDL